MFLYSISKFLESHFRSNLIVKVTVVLSLVINAVTWIVLYWKLQPFSYLADAGQIYLHYNVYFGIDSIGPWYYAFALPGIGLLFFLLNNILAYAFYIKDKMLSYFLIISQTVLQAVLLVAGIFMILLNI